MNILDIICFRISPTSFSHILLLKFLTGGHELGNLDNPQRSCQPATQRRGPTYCTNTWGRPKNKGLIKVDFNDKGQPIGNNRKRLSSFLGTIARNGKHAPLNYESWTKMPNTYKKDMIEIIKVIIRKSVSP
jgi:hypothetical protein